MIIAKVVNLQNPRRAFAVGKKHYDIGNDLYRKMLDRRMIYSCGYWRNAKNLDEAQEAKLGPERGMKVLDIGCGWGGTAEYLARRYGPSGRDSLPRRPEGVRTFGPHGLGWNVRAGRCYLCPMNRYMQAAVEEAHYGVESREGGPFGAVIVHEGTIVGRGHNTVVTTNDPTAHAEINAIREASKTLGRFDLSDCTIYTTCEPCPMCYSALYWARIPVVYRGATQQDAAAIGFDDKEIYDDLAGAPENRKIPMKEIDREACLEPFRLWQSKPDRVLY